MSYSASFRKSSFALIITLFWCSSCAWNKGELHKWFSKKASTDNTQLQKVGAKDEELAKFSIQETPQSEAVVVPKKIINPKPLVTKKNPSSSKLTSKPIILKTAEKVDPYPTDYPAELKLADKRAEESWKLFKPLFDTDEKMMLDVDYLGMTVGKVVLRYRGLKSINAKSVHHFQAFFKSAPFYSAIYELDDQLDTFVEKENFVGVRSNLVQRESKQDVDEVQLYDRETLRTTAYQKRVKDGKTKKSNWSGFIPKWSIDPLSVLWLIRGLPLKTGDKYYLPIVNKGKTLVLEATVAAREVIKTKVGEKASIRVHAFTQYTGKTLKSGDMTFWLTDDKVHTLIRAKAKIKIGSVFAELAEGE
jgi:hypothetical protein